jgi:hypothetical protein
MANETIRILSIDGGGIRGIIPARILARIEDATGQHTSALFHLIAGTSSGGILGCGLVKGNWAHEIAELYIDHGGKIFPRPFLAGVEIGDRASNPDCDPCPLEQVLGQELGDTWLSESFGAELLVPSYAIRLPFERGFNGLGSLVGGAPYFFKSWKTNGSNIDPEERASELDFLLRDIARATSAAPTYFPPALIQNRAGQNFGMIDGGVFAKNPAMYALAFAQKLFPQAKHFMLVSLGTGSFDRPIPDGEAKKFGFFHLARPILRMLADPNARINWSDVNRLLKLSHFFLDISGAKNSDLVHWARPVLDALVNSNARTTCCEVDRILGPSHFRFDIPLGINSKEGRPEVGQRRLRGRLSRQHCQHREAS